MAEHIDGDHVVAVFHHLDLRLPDRGIHADAVDEQHRRAGAGADEAGSVGSRASDQGGDVSHANHRPP